MRRPHYLFVLAVTAGAAITVLFATRLGILVSTTELPRGGRQICAEREVGDDF